MYQPSRRERKIAENKKEKKALRYRWLRATAQEKNRLIKLYDDAQEKS